MLKYLNKSAILLSVMSIVAGCGSEVPSVTNFTSPNGDVSVKVTTLFSEGQSEYGNLYCSLHVDGKLLMDGIELGIVTNKQDYYSQLKPINVGPIKTVRHNYTMLTGKRSQCSNLGHERVYSFKNPAGAQLDVIFRIYNDGIAFSYRIPAAEEGEIILSENTAYPIKDGTKRWIQPHVGGGYEEFFPLATDGASHGWRDRNKWSYPALVQAASDDELFMLITESNMRRNHCGSYLDNSKQSQLYQLTLFSQDQPVENNWQSPWRLFIVGELDDIVESTLVTDLADPSTISDTEWIQPGNVSWIYWAYNHGSQEYSIIKEYIDLAKYMQWPYMLIDAEWDVMRGGNIEQALKYAVDNDIKPLLWYNSGTNWAGPNSGAPTPWYSLNKKEDRVKEFAWLKANGGAGVKIDFFRPDNMETMNYYLDLIEDAADAKLMANFHGGTIPRGWQRTYPNLMTFEAVYGAEWYNNNRTLTNKAAAHNATLPFTRNVIGSMDYTPGTFTDSQNPHITTHAHELALMVIFESGLQHRPDRPSAYYEMPQEIRQLLTELPTAWDDTKLVSGYPGEDVVMARRKGKVWYIGGINGTDAPRNLDLDLDEIEHFGNTIQFITDREDGKGFVISNPERISRQELDRAIKTLPRGGFVAVIK
ncbi:MAG: glycoside hydrolase family 97 protein [Bacteroidaceae bacterium]|nr:glycoside hydrolase family 97 protein [Bacteroidaceae bacterium]